MKLLNCYLEKKSGANLILTGPKGVGKFTAAKQLAMEILSCKETQLAIHPDCMIVSQEDGKAILVETISEILNFTSLMPIRASQKVVLIDNAENMNELVQNKLLKVVEESNSTVFIFVTTSPLLTTIHSRCFDIPFFPLENADIQKYLDKKEESSAMPLCAYGGSIGIYENMKGDDTESSTLLKNIMHTFENMEKKADIMDVFHQWSEKEAGKFFELQKPHMGLIIQFLEDVFADFYLYLVSGGKGSMLDYKRMEQLYTHADAERIYKKAREERLRIKTNRFSKNDFFMLIASMAL